MKQASIPLYIRFGEIPTDEISEVHRGDSVIREEGGVSVWRAVESNGLFIEGADREPLLNNVKIIKEITKYYRK